MPAFDLRTVALLVASISVLVAVILASFARLVGRRYPGVPLWAWASGFNALGFVLRVLRGALPDLWSVVVANVVLVAAMALTLTGTNRFVGRARPAQELGAWLLVALTAVLFVPLTYVAPSVPWRTAIVNSAIGVIDLLCVWSLLRAPLPTIAAARRFAAAVLGLNGCWHLLRATLAAGGERVIDVFEPSAAQTLIFLLSLLALLLWAVGAVAMVMQRLLGDLQRSQVSELQAIQTSARDAEQRADEARELLDALTEANQVVREREQLFRLAFDRSPLGAALVSPEGQFLRVNEELCTIAGHSEAELLRRDVFSIVLPEDRDSAIANARALVDGAERVSVELRARRTDGTPIWMQVTAGLVRSEDGAPVHMLALVENITARKQTEQRLRTVFVHAVAFWTIIIWSERNEGSDVLAELAWRDAAHSHGGRFHHVAAAVSGRVTQNIDAHALDESESEAIADLSRRLQRPKRHNSQHNSHSPKKDDGPSNEEEPSTASRRAI